MVAQIKMVAMEMEKLWISGILVEELIVLGSVDARGGETGMNGEWLSNFRREDEPGGWWHHLLR
jgi:hypothetical protein